MILYCRLFFVCHQIHSTTWLNCFNWLYEKNTNFRQSICVKERLGVAFRYLASGDSQQSVGWAHRISKATISKIIKETTNLIWQVLKEVYLKPPQEMVGKPYSKDLKIFGTFLIPSDEKYIAIECPNLSGVQYFNYKGFFRVVLLAICNINFFFT